jgi:hypothetical protein
MPRYPPLSTSVATISGPSADRTPRTYTGSPAFKSSKANEVDSVIRRASADAVRSFTAGGSETRTGVSPVHGGSGVTTNVRPATSMDASVPYRLSCCHATRKSLCARCRSLRSTTDNRNSAPGTPWTHTRSPAFKSDGRTVVTMPPAVIGSLEIAVSVGNLTFFMSPRASLISSVPPNGSTPKIGPYSLQRVVSSAGAHAPNTIRVSGT